jgi:hypothetical protein
LASIKNVQVKEEAFSSQRKPSNTSKHDFKKKFTFVGHFCPPGSGSGSTDPIESGSATLDSSGTYSTAVLLLLRAGGDRSRSNSSYNQEEDISRLVECMALNTTSDEESEASEASKHVNYVQIHKHNFP